MLIGLCYIACGVWYSLVKTQGPGSIQPQSRRMFEEVMRVAKPAECDAPSTDMLTTAHLLVLGKSFSDNRKSPVAEADPSG